MDFNIHIRQSVIATHNMRMDIYNDNSNMDIQNSIVEVRHLIMYIHN